MSKKFQPISLGSIVAIFFGFVLVLTALQRLLTPVIPVVALPEDGEPCKGVPLVVDYPYEGGMLQPHECKVQCEEDDAQWRYILYTNGKATQCEAPPMCSDWGEDNGILCEPPLEEKRAE